MTPYKNFLKKLRATPRTWRVRRYDGYIRNANDCCPLEAAANLGCGDWRKAGKKLLLKHHHAEKITVGADCKGSDTMRIRRDILEACGLEDK
jgi:hypothetical protein